MISIPYCLHSEIFQLFVFTEEVKYALESIDTRLKGAILQCKRIRDCIFLSYETRNTQEQARELSTYLVCRIFKRVAHNEISPRIFESIPVEQADFRPNRTCRNQILSLPTFIEAEFQRQLKQSAVFIDLTAAYGSVWRHVFVCKLAPAIPFLKTITLIKYRHIWQNHSLPQGSVLAPLVFSLYTVDVAQTTLKK